MFINNNNKTKWPKKELLVLIKKGGYILIKNMIIHMLLTRILSLIVLVYECMS